MASLLAYELGRALAYFAKFRPKPTRELIAAEAGIHGLHMEPTVGPWVGDLLEVLILARRPERILEIGTSTGYASMIMGKAAATYGGAVTTIEENQALADRAREHIQSTGLTKTVDVVCADTKDTVETLSGTFGLILQDGDKELYSALLPKLIELLEPKGVLVTDDVLCPIMESADATRDWQHVIDQYNRDLASRDTLRTAWLPIGDGVSVSVKLK